MPGSFPNSDPADGVERAGRTWTESFHVDLLRLMQLRRDVRSFRRDPLPTGCLDELLRHACLAPSVGYSQPWRCVTVQSTERRDAIAEEFDLQNDDAASRYDAETQRSYRELKLAGLRDAPEHVAVFCEPDPTAGRQLGRLTMPESVDYSVVAAIQNLWLAARSRGIGVGWVSILRPDCINTVLDVPTEWKLIAYLCIGYPEVSSDEPLLRRVGWQTQESDAVQFLRR